MAANRDKIMHGIRFMAIALPLVFSGPALYVAMGLPASRDGNYVWMAVSVLIMLIAVYFAVRGLRTILQGFFND